MLNKRGFVGNMNGISINVDEIWFIVDEFLNNIVELWFIVCETRGGFLELEAH